MEHKTQPSMVQSNFCPGNHFTQNSKFWQIIQVFLQNRVGAARSNFCPQIAEDHFNKYDLLVFNHTNIFQIFQPKSVKKCH